MTRPIVIALLTAVLWMSVAGGCTRAGLGVQQDASGSALPDGAAGTVDQRAVDQQAADQPASDRQGGDVSAPDLPPGALRLDEQYDTCAKQLQVPDGPSATLVVSTAAASNDYALGCCGGNPELVVDLPDSWSWLNASCVSGGGRLVFIFGSSCPISGRCASQDCDGKGNFGSAIAPGDVLIICRDPSLPSATVALSP